MKYSADRQEKKGLFGGIFYETYIKVTLTSEEENIARKQKMMGNRLIGGPDEEGQLVYSLCGTHGISMYDLTNGIGISAKVRSIHQLGKLSLFENTLRERCKSFKAKIEAVEKLYGSDGSGGFKREEEF